MSHLVLKERKRGGVVHVRDIKQLEGFNMDPRHIVCSYYTFNNKQDMDYEWMEKQIQYLDGLSDRKKHTIYVYTIYGDKFANEYLRGILTQERAVNLLNIAQKNNENPFKYQHEDKSGRTEIDDDYKENIMEYVQKYVTELSDIINKSPKLTRQIKVYRGLTNATYIHTGMEKNILGRSYFTNKDFISTSFYLPSAVMFMQKAKNSIEINIDSATEAGGRLLELLIEPGTPCILTARLGRRRGEYEITLAHNTIMRLVACKLKYIIYDEEDYNRGLDYVLAKKTNKQGIVGQFIVHPEWLEL
jgi:hypothetical protein